MISHFSLKRLIIACVFFAGTALIALPETIEDLYDPELKPFYHGVASGDPLPDGFIIWTRVTSDRPGRGPIPVFWDVATDSEMSNIVVRGRAIARPSSDYTVKVDVRGLDAGKTYYYRFFSLGAYSLTGKAKTAPTEMVESIKFAVVSCSNYEWGYFSGYAKIADRTDLDAVIHLGDYTYEYSDNASYSSPAIRDERVLFPAHETVTLEDYRIRYANYRLDPNLRRAHQQHPFIVVWDDHESANDAWTSGAENHDPETQGSWEVRKAVSKQAYFEWMPIRESGSSIFRAFSYGPLVDLIMIDTRLEGRDEQILDVTAPGLYAPTRTLLGSEQKAWLSSQLSESTAKWKVIGNQVIFSPFNIGWAAAIDPSQTYQSLESIFLDIWDGYPVERSILIQELQAQNIDNTVFLTGDFHSSFAFDVVDFPYDFPNSFPSYDPATGFGAVAVEFATPSISAANFDENLDDMGSPGTSALLESLINQPIELAGGLNFNPHMAYADLDQHGYFVLTLAEDAAQADYYYLADILVVETTENWGAGLITLEGANHLNFADAEAAPKSIQDTPAPASPQQRPQRMRRR